MTVRGAALDKVSDGDPDEGGQGVDKPQRPDGEIAEEQQHRGEKQHGGEDGVIQLQAVVSAAQDAAD